MDQLPKDNVLAVSLAVQEQRNLVQDAITELEQAKTDQKSSQIPDDEEDEDFEADDKWTANELSAVAPALGLLKTSQALLKRIEMSCRKNGSTFASETSCHELDDILDHCEEISPLADDLAMSLYPPLSVEEVDKNGAKLSNKCLEIINVQLRQKHFVTPEELDDWGAFLLKALTHNSDKLKAALVVCGLGNVAI